MMCECVCASVCLHTHHSFPGKCMVQSTPITYGGGEGT